MSYAIFPTLANVPAQIKKRPTWNTAQERTAAGNEFRTGFQQFPVNEFDITYPFLSQADKNALEGFLNEQGGSLTPFYFDVLNDDSVSAYQFGTGDGTTTVFTLYKPAGNGSIEIPGGFIGAPNIYKSDWQGNQLQYSTPRTNTLLYSDNLTNGVWTPTTGTTTTAGTNVGPDGTTSGGTISYAGTGTSGSYRIYQGATTPPSGESWVASIWLKVASGTLNLRLTNNFHSIPITVTTSWQRFQVSGTSNGIGAAQIILYSASGDNSAWTVDYAFAQLEQASSATSYIPTTTSAVTVTDYTLSGNQITFASAPAAGALITWSGQYYYLVRFKEDKIEFTQFANGLYKTGNITLVQCL